MITLLDALVPSPFVVGLARAQQGEPPPRKVPLLEITTRALHEWQDGAPKKTEPRSDGEAGRGSWWSW